MKLFVKTCRKTIDKIGESVVFYFLVVLEVQKC